MFNYLCIQMQKSFRGYYSRKYKHDQTRRKRYAAAVTEQGERVRLEMERYNQLQIEREAIEAQRKKEEEFKSYAKNLHHLVSTKQIRGIYNPSMEYLETPTMDNVGVEEHIRGVVKDLLRSKGIHKTGLVADINGTKKIPLKGLKYRLSIQVMLCLLLCDPALINLCVNRHLPPTILWKKRRSERRTSTRY